MEHLPSVHQYHHNMKTFVILNTDELGIVNFDQVAEISAEYCRYSLDGTKTFVKYIGEQPSFLSGKTEYTHSEMLTILATDEWTDPNPPGE